MFSHPIPEAVSWKQPGRQCEPQGIDLSQTHTETLRENALQSISGWIDLSGTLTNQTQSLNAKLFI